MLKRDTTAINDDTFIVDQLDSVFSKIKIIDGSVDKDELHCQLLDYYRAKFGNPDLANFHYEFIDKTTPRLIQFHTFKNAANPPFLGGFSIFSIVAA